MDSQNSQANASEITQALDRFELAWQLAEPPRLDEFLRNSALAADHPADRRRWLVELIPIDLECRWRRFGPRSDAAAAKVDVQSGDLPARATLADYAAAFADLGPVAQLPVELFVAEYYARRSWGDWTGPGDWELAYPAPVPAYLPRIQQAEAALARERQLTSAQLTASISKRNSEHVSTVGGQETPPAAASALLDPGVQLGDYLLLERLGKGGMGEVFKAEHVRMKRVVALKVLSGNQLATPAAAKRFEREVIAVSRLRHPHIVEAYDAREDHGTHYLVMEYVPGIDLSRLVRESGVLPVEKAVDLIVQAAQGLTYAHTAGVVHRDLKPANLILSAGIPVSAGSETRGTLKILDMGLARLDAAGAQQDELTGTGQIMGTVDFMAPEQAMSSKRADARSDIYSLGATLWYLLAGRAMYSGDTAIEKLMAHQTNPIPSLRAARPDIPPALGAIFEKMVAKQPDDRYQSMAELLVALEACSSSVTASATHPRRKVAHSLRARSLGQWLAASIAALVLLAATVVIIRNRQGEELARITVPDDSTVEIHPSAKEANKPQTGKPTTDKPTSPPSVKIAVQPSESIAEKKSLSVAPAQQPVKPAIEAESAASIVRRYFTLRSRRSPQPPSDQRGNKSDDIVSPASSLFDKMRREDIPASMLDPPPKLDVPIVAAFGGPPLPHWGEVRYAALSPDEHLLVTSGADGCIRVWDVQTRQSLACWQVPLTAFRTLYSCRLSDDGKSLLAIHESSTGRDGFASSVTLFEMPKLNLRASFAIPNRWRSIDAISPDGKLATLSNSGVVSGKKGSEALGAVLDLVDKKIRYEFVEWAPASSIRTTEKLVWQLVTKSSSVAVWDLDRGVVARELSVKAKQLCRGGLSPGGTRLVALNSDGELVLWDLEKDMQVSNWDKTRFVSQVCWLSEDRPLVLQDSDIIHDPATGTKRKLKFSASSSLLETPARDKLISAEYQVVLFEVDPKVWTTLG